MLMAFEQQTPYQRIYAAVRRIPVGCVATYGQIAELSEWPNRARQVGFALSTLDEDTEADVPWHRVVNAQGQISSRTNVDASLLQRDLLEAEGIKFDADGRLDLAQHGWSGTI